MDNEKFLVELGLYDKIEVDYTDYADLIDLLSGNSKIDLYCNRCKEKRTFIADPKYKRLIKHKKYEPIVTNVFDTYSTEEDEEIYSCIRRQEEREKRQDFERFLKDNELVDLHYVCSRNDDHHLIFILLIDGFTIQKIGQYPSYADIDIPQADIYRKELGDKYYSELKRAIGLYSCHIGIGSYVYLRRIIEKILLDTAQEAIKDGVITSKELEIDENNHQRRFEDKIKLLSAYLPKPLVDNKTVYGIVSKGIHELTEDECNKYFPVIEQLIKMCLDESIVKKKKKADEENLKKKLLAIKSEINKK